MFNLRESCECSKFTSGSRSSGNPVWRASVMTFSSLCCFSFRVSSVATKIGNDARSVRAFPSRFFVC